MTFAGCGGNQKQASAQTKSKKAASEEKNEEKKETKDKEDTGKSDEKEVDVDLTVLSATMVYSEVYNMMVTPEDYIGKTVKMSGLCGTFHDDVQNKTFYACIAQDATACCAQGIEFELTGDAKYPEEGSR